ncbi:hypothetical protein ADIS_3895 [Lunatimonas lonarensis]|uniref:Uncharacterized protein n=1 Tax=Lunatimonas lonarensis TaxID=1232681 RepID=R7ZNN4_9BACT|nr:hypothetical protein ADIS_3895 [Lunatimonas lonarensis]
MAEILLAGTDFFCVFLIYPKSSVFLKKTPRKSGLKAGKRYI